MTLPSVGSTGQNSSNGSGSLQTSNQAVVAGSAIYVQVAMYGTSLSTPTLADSQGGTFKLLTNGSTATMGVYLWIFRRTSPVSSSTTYNVTAVPSSSSSSIEVIAIEVLNDGGYDAYGSIQLSIGTSETASVATSVLNDLVLFLGADNSGTFNSWGSGQTAISGYPVTPPANVTAWGSYQTQASVGTATSSRFITASSAWIAVSVAIHPQTLWSGLAGKPYVTVSPIGTTLGGATISNNGADFGPDTPGTTTSGINEAVNSGAQVVYLLAGEFNCPGTIYLPALYGISLIGSISSQVQPPTAPSSRISYTGSGWAIDTASGGNLTSGARGYIDGIEIYSSGSGVRLTDVYYNVGTLFIGGTSAAGSYGLYITPISNPPEQQYNFLKVDAFEYLIYTESEHVTISHLNTGWTPFAGSPLIQVSGYGFHIGYWHHYANGPAVPSYALEIPSSSSTAGPIRIDVMLYEGASNGLPSGALFHNAGTDNGAVISVGHLAYRIGGGPVGITYPQISATEDLVSVDHIDGSLRFGLEPVRVIGQDMRSGLTAADPSPITLYSAVSNRRLRLQANLGSGGGAWTSGTATYTVSWTDAISNTVKTNVISVNGNNQLASIASMIIIASAGTNVTVQLTGSWAGGDTVTVTAIVEILN